MKNIYLIGGTMGVGKTTTCQILKNKLRNCVFLDGDWCWDSHPFLVTEETRAMVMENIAFLLNQFLRCGAYDHVLFCWVLHRREIWEDLLSRLDTEGISVYRTALTCTAEALAERLRGDIRAGRRRSDALERGTQYLPLYESLGLPLLDTTALTAAETAERLREEML